MDFPEKRGLVRLVQDRLGLAVDGVDGPRTWGAIAKVAGVRSEKVVVPNAGLPADRVSEIIKVYGQQGDEGNLVRFRFPYRMRLYNTQRVLKTHRCHRLCKVDLEGILEAARDELGLEFLQAHDLDTYYGCFNDRKMRGRSQGTSRHSWGIAIDLAAHVNGFKTAWPGKATMPVEMVRIFERYGWKSLARVCGKDAQHFQRTK